MNRCYSLARLVGVALCLAASPLWAQFPETLMLADGTPVSLQLEETVSSAHARVGDPLSFIVVNDVTVNGFTVIQAGSKATGSLTRVHSRRVLGMGGKLVLNVDSVELANGDHVALRASKEMKGTSHTWRMAAGVALTSIFYFPVAPVFLLTRGDNCTALKSTAITAHIDGNTSLPSTNFSVATAKAPDVNQAIEFLPPRVLDGEGHQGDMVNLLFIGQKEDLQAAFDSTGWVKPEHWKLSAAWHVFTQRTHYIRQPMSRFFLFGRTQDYAYAMPDPIFVMSHRHHIRIWETGHQVDGNPVWAGAATYDVAIEVAKHGRLFNHRIDPNVDSERDFIGAKLSQTTVPVRETYIEGAEPVYQAKTASGQDYYSDSKILLVDLRPSANGEALVHPAAAEATVHPAAPAAAPPVTSSLSATLR
jgi:LssY C-terminus